MDAPPYVATMFTLPRPASPKSAFADLRDILVTPRAHKWPLLALSFTMTGLMIWAFDLDIKQIGSSKPPREIIYVQNWTADRKDSDILTQQKIDLARYEAALSAKQREFQAVADKMGIEWREDEARNRARRAKIVAAINADIDKRLAEAKAKEAAAAAMKAKPAGAADAPR